MKSTPWIRYFPRDWAGDTSHLSTEEVGAYHLLWDHMLIHGELPKPDDHRALQKITRTSARKWQNMREVLLAYFTTNELGHLDHNRIRQEMEWSRNQHKSRALGAHITNEKRRQNKQKAQRSAQRPANAERSRSATQSEAESDSEEPIVTSEMYYTTPPLATGSPGDEGPKGPTQSRPPTPATIIADTLAAMGDRIKGRPLMGLLEKHGDTRGLDAIRATKACYDRSEIRNPYAYWRALVTSDGDIRTPPPPTSVSSPSDEHWQRARAKRYAHMLDADAEDALPLVTRYPTDVLDQAMAETYAAERNDQLGNRSMLDHWATRAHAIGSENGNGGAA